MGWVSISFLVVSDRAMRIACDCEHVSQCHPKQGDVRSAIPILPVINQSV